MTDLVTIIPRLQWGSRYDYDARHAQRFRAAAPVKVETCLHTTVTIAPNLVKPWDDEHAAMRLLEDIGTDRFGSGVSYNVCVMPSGRAYAGQPLDNKSTHSEYGDWNYTRASIALVGNYEKDRPTTAMLETVARIQATWLADGTIPTVTLRGHYEVAPKSCPGKYAIAEMDTIATRARTLVGYRPPLSGDDMTIQDLVDALRDNDHPLTKQLRRHMRETWQEEMGQERAGENERPPLT